MIYVVLSQEDRAVNIEKIFKTHENAKEYVDSLQFSREIKLDWQKFHNTWCKSYKTPGSHIVFSIYEREIHYEKYLK